MGHIKEPKGIDFTVDPKQLTKEELKSISEVIAHYKLTGKKKKISRIRKSSTISVGRKKASS